MKRRAFLAGLAAAPVAAQLGPAFGQEGAGMVFGHDVAASEATAAIAAPSPTIPREMFMWLVRHLDADMRDILFTSSDVAPTAPPGYAVERRVGWVVRTSGAILPFAKADE